MDLVIEVDNPTAADVRDLVERHLAFAAEVTPLCDVHALGLDGLLDASVTLVSARRGTAVVGIGALRQLDASHGEIKSMHTRDSERGRGVGRAILSHLLNLARARRYRRVSLETGTMAAFAPARSMYAAAGFTECAPFGSYTANPSSMCMTIAITGEDASEEAGR